MKKVRFDENEMLVVAMLDENDRGTTLNRMKAVLPVIRGDEDLSALVISTIEKMKQISDQEYHELDLETYKLELAEEDEEEDVH